MFELIGKTVDTLRPSMHDGAWGYVMSVSKKSVIYASLVALAAVTSCLPAWAQNNQIYRCGNQYTNNPPAGLAGCKLVEGGNVTVVRGAQQVQADRVTSMSQTINKMGEQQQKARDTERRQILQDELVKAQARQADLMRQYNNGEPERMGPEFRNYQMYQDRVAQMKADIERNQGDIDALQRELTQAGAASK